MSELRAYCPACQGGVPDPLTEYVDICHDHRPDTTGSADALVRLSWGPDTVETAEQTRAACDAIHRACPSPSSA